MQKKSAHHQQISEKKRPQKVAYTVQWEQYGAQNGPLWDLTGSEATEVEYFSR